MSLSFHPLRFFRHLRGQLDSIIRELQSLHQQQEALRGDLQSMHQQQEALQGKLQSIHQQQEALRGDLQSMHQQQEALQGKLQSIHQQQEALRGDLQSMHQQQEAKHAEILQAKAEIGTQIQRFSSLSTQLNKFYGDFNAVKIKNAANQFVLLKDLIARNVTDAEAERIFKRINVPGRTGDPVYPVAYVTDHNYLRPAVVSALSLLDQAQNPSKFQIYILYSGVAQEIIQKYKRCFHRIHFQEITKDYNDLAGTHIWVSSSAMIKFDLPDLFPQYDKLLYLDADTLIKSDITPLFETELNGQYAAVVKDLTGMLLEHHHEKMNHELYFNSGLMLMDLKKMRGDAIPQKLKEAKKNDPWKHFMDQDAFNVVIGEHVRCLSPIYNMMLDNLQKMNLPISIVSKFYGLSIAEMMKIIHAPAIQHFSNVDKPWSSFESVDCYDWRRTEYCLVKILEKGNPADKL